jgi:Uma2 family endonuclease
MSRTRFPVKDVHNMKDLVMRLGDIPLERIRTDPPPGTATERDLLRVVEREKILCELIDGTLVEKPMGAKEGFLAAELIRGLGNFVAERDLGVVFAPDSTLRIYSGQVRLPDVCFVSWDRLPGRMVPAEAIPDLVPEFTIEVLSPSNTRSEMLRKRKEFFLAGTQLFWIIDPNTRTLTAYSAPDVFETFAEPIVVFARPVLPQFEVSLASLFARLPKA